MKIDPIKFAKYISIATLNRETSYALFNFAEDYVVFYSYNAGMTMLSSGKVVTTEFVGYVPLGKVFLPANLAEILKTKFREDEMVDIVFDQQNISVTGRKVSWIEVLPKPDNFREINFKEGNFFFLLPNLKGEGTTYKIDVNELKDLDVGDTVVIEYNNELIFRQQESLSKYTKKATVIERYGEGSGKVSLYTDYISTVTKLFKGEIYMTFFATDAPVVISEVERNAKFSIFILPIEG